MDNQRLILFIVFSFSLLLLWESWQARHAPQPAAPAATQSAPAAETAPAPSQTLNASATPAQAGFAKGARAVVETDVMRATLDANGGDLRELQLLKYRETDNKQDVFTLFEDSQARPYVAQSGLVGKNLPTHRSVYALTPGVYRLAAGAGQVEVPMTWTDPATGVQVEKTYIFKRGSYEIGVRTRVINRGTQPLELAPYYQFVRHGQAPRGESFFLYTYTGPVFYTEAKKFQKVTFKHIADGKADFDKVANNGWAGMVQHHFVSAWLPQGNVKREFFAKNLGDDLYSSGLILGEGVLAPGQEKTFTLPLYAGPQIQALLEKTAPGLDLARDYGWLTPLAYPIFWSLEKIERIVGNWGWAIIILTLLIKLALYPLSAAGYKSMAKMRTLTPRLQRLKETYGDDRAKLHQAMAEMYKTEKINPLGGCLPILIQIPVFIALYWVLLAAVEMRGAPWLGWITDLTAPDPYFILPIIMGITSILQVKLNPQPMDPLQAKIMMIMPVAFTVMFVFFPAGLVLYWVVNNILSIAQQWAINRQVESATPIGKKI
ncbi:MAG: membrane protein insertase YidC [Thiobacillus sp.]